MEYKGTLSNPVYGLASLCKIAKKWVIYIAFDGKAPFEELRKNFPIMTKEFYDTNFNIGCYITDDSEDAWKVFNSIKGDEVVGTDRVYALIIDDNGEILSENT